MSLNKFPSRQENCFCLQVLHFASLLHSCPHSNGSRGGLLGLSQGVQFKKGVCEQIRPSFFSVFLLELEGLGPKVETIQLRPPSGG